MNKMAIIFFLLVFVLIGINMIRGFSNTKLETPEYQLLEESGPFQIRKYKPIIIARTLVESNYKEATYTGFRRIANYIFGGNSKNMEIAMTAPVISNSPINANDYYEIFFVMPKSHNINILPYPNNSNVQVMERNLGKVAVVSFGGWATKSKVERYHKKLNKWVEKEDYILKGNFMVAQYNSPWALPPFRHNEIMVQIK
tara:strand:+ start:76682 stop:77278 length:597 start_codon:yes stop_codon:yes gene_type:complete